MADGFKFKTSACGMKHQINGSQILMQSKQKKNFKFFVKAFSSKQALIRKSFSPIG